MTTGLLLLACIFLLSVIIVVALFRLEIKSMCDLHNKECNALQQQLTMARSKMSVVQFLSRRELLIQELAAGTRNIMSITHGRSSDKQTRLFHDLYQQKLQFDDWTECVRWQDEMLNGFHRRLMQDNPKLSLQHQQLSLLFMLDTPNYVVAILMDMADSSIPTTKLRLGRKLGQESSLLLHTYLMGLLCCVD